MISRPGSLPALRSTYSDSATFRADDRRGGNAAEQIAISVVEAYGKESAETDFDPSLDLVPDGKITLDDFFRFADRFGQ